MFENCRLSNSYNNAILKDVGIRPGERIHEKLIDENDSNKTIEFNGYYVIVSPDFLWDFEKYRKSQIQLKGKVVRKTFLCQAIIKINTYRLLKSKKLLKKFLKARFLKNLIIKTLILILLYIFQVIKLIVNSI